MHDREETMQRPQTTTATPQTLLDHSTNLLRLRHLAAAKNHALLAHKSYPTRPEFPQIIAVADVLLAADKRLPNNLLDWSAILQLDNIPNNQNLSVIRAQFKKLVLLLNPIKDRFPYAGEAFQLVCDSWYALSDPKKKAQLESLLKNETGGAKKKRNRRKEETFWTLCPYCFYLHQYEGLYRDCCLMCQNCRKAFQAMAVPAPEKGMLVEEKDEYYCGFGYFRMEYNLDNPLGRSKDKNADSCFLGEKKAKESGFKVGLESLVEISDDSEDDTVNGGKVDEQIGQKNVFGSEREVMKNGGEKVESNTKIGEAVNFMQGAGRTDQVNNSGMGLKKNVKSVPRNTKKIMGRGKRIRMDMNTEYGGVADKSGAETVSIDEIFDDLGVFMGEDDVFVDLGGM